MKVSGRIADIEKSTKLSVRRGLQERAHDRRIRGFARAYAMSVSRFAAR